MVKEAIHRKMPEVLKSHIAIDAETFDEYSQLLLREKATSVSATVDVLSRRPYEPRRLIVSMLSQTGDRTIRFREEWESANPAKIVGESRFAQATAMLTAIDRLLRLSETVPELQISLIGNLQRGTQELNIDYVATRAKRFGAEPIPLQASSK